MYREGQLSDGSESDQEEEGADKEQALLECREVVQNGPCQKDASDDINRDEADEKSFRYKLLLQLCIINAYIALGAFAEFIGPTLQDLMEMLGVSYEAIAKGLAVRAAAVALGAMVGVFLRDIINRRPAFIMVLGLLCAALGLLLIPFSTSVLMFSFVMLLPGLGEGILGLGGVEQTMNIWHDKSAGPMQSLYFAFDLGAILMTESVRPFLSPDTEPELESTPTLPSTLTEQPAAGNNSTMEHLTTMNMTIIAMEPTSSNLIYPFIIVVSYTVFAALIMAIFHCYESFKFPRDRQHISCQPLPIWKKCTSERVRVVVITLCAAMFCFHSCGGEESYMTYLFSYAVVSGADFTKYQATTLMSVVRASLLVGRFCGMIAAYFIKIQYMMIISVVVLITTYSCMALLVTKAAVVLWLLAIVAGLFTSILYAAGMSWGNLYVKTNSFITLIWITGASLGSLSYGYVTGTVFDAYSVATFPYVMLGYAVSLFILFIFMQIVASFHQERFSADDNKTDTLATSEGMNTEL